MKTSKIDRFVSVVVIGICLVKAVLYGGSKPPVSTNTPPDNVIGEASTNSVPDEQPGPTGVSPVGGSLAMTSAKRTRCPFPRSSFPQTSDSTLVTNWTARGALSDWQRIDFPGDFAFPCGTNLLVGVTLFAWGELRESLRSDGVLAVDLGSDDSGQTATTGTSSPRIAVLPRPVSLEPCASSISHGLTPSNSYRFAWQNVCVNREATNRVDAAIELFASGDIVTRFGDWEGRAPARPPEGFVGIGQDNAWAFAAFPADYTAITNKGYEAWLMEDKVGINEPNGLYKVSITVSQLPEHGPCYLVCGPYKVVVTSPGTYSFPLEVFEHYAARTYPVAVPLSIDYDDGYRGEVSDPGLLRMSPPRQLLGVPLIFA